MPDLFDPLTLRGVTLRNRIGLPPLCQYVARDGVANDWHLVHLGARAVGGAGLVIVEATGVEPRGRITPGCLGLWCDAQIEPLARVTRFLAGNGAVPAIQLANAGRNASATPPWQGDRTLAPEDGGWETVGPSPIAFDGPGGALHHVPREMTLDDIATVCQAFADAARRADAAGFELLELHAAHGYLLHSFLSPLTNRRSDAYGGGFDNRVRFTLETVRALRAAWPEEKPLAVRLSTVDWAPGGWTLDDSVALARRLEDEGVDLVDCSTGAIVPEEQYEEGPSWQVPMAARIRRETGIATAAVGCIVEPRQADAIVRNGDADLVLVGTEMMRDPAWPFHAAETLGALARLRMPSSYDYVIRPGYDAEPPPSWTSVGDR
jgi:2,4-dienoyl-CoA reductase-like NADH-dependent reductase (Old Yellow Enzyme family)